jgi:beta-glucosidase
MNCGFKNEYLDLPKAVAAGLIDEKEIDTALKRVLGTRARLGILPASTVTPWSDVPYSANHSPAHRELALRAAREAIVLLKNDGILPLAPGKKIAVVGPTAASLIALEGNYNGTPVGAVLPVDGMIAAYGDERVSYAQGSPFVSELPLPVSRTVLGEGVTATFYKGTELSGAPVATRRYPEFDLNWNWISPATRVDSSDFSVRFSGTLRVPEPGTYRFQLERRRCDANAQVERYVIRIEGADPLVVDEKCSARDAGGSANAVTIRLDDTRPRPFTVEYAHRHSGHGYAPALTFVWQPPAGALQHEAMRVARDADVIVAFVGLSAWLEGEEMDVKVPGFAGGDRTDIRLPEAQRQLLAALEATGKPVVIVLQTGSAVPLGEEGQKAQAIINAWYGGEQGGAAIADVLTGKYNPAGRLPITVYSDSEKLPDFADYSMAGRTYRYFTGKPEYPFGYGLSYTRFRYSKVRIQAPLLAAGKPQQVSVKVRNDGAIPGDEVVQLYVSPERRDAPLRSLKGFERVHVPPGEERTIEFKLDPRDLAFADASGTMRIVPGEYSLWVGGGQPGSGAPGAAVKFRMTGEVALDP